MNKIYYMGYYDSFENKEENRNTELAAQTKIAYITSALEDCGCSVEIVSPVVTNNNSFYNGKVIPVGKSSQLRLFATWPKNPKFLRIIGRYITDIQLFFYLWRTLKKTDTFIVYHGLAQMKKVRWLKKHLKFRMIMEIEEIYGDVNGDQELKNREMEYFKLADGYIFPAVQLHEKINTENKPYVLIHGTYQVEEPRNCCFDAPESKNKIHCVYAGTLDPRKGGGVMAAQAVEYLPENYHLHILGFGSAADTDRMKKLVGALQAKCKATITYDGCLKGEEYIRFLQCCHIGLSTQNPNAAFNDTSFPSKILSYMANGLQVVTVRIPVVERSAVGPYVHFYDEATPQAVAAAIESVDCSKTTNKYEQIRMLDLNCRRDLKTILEA